MGQPEKALLVNGNTAGNGLPDHVIVYRTLLVVRRLVNSDTRPSCREFRTTIEEV